MRSFFSLVRRFPQLIIIRPVIVPSSSGRRIVPVPRRGGLGVGSSSSHSSGSSHSSSSLPHLITERRRWCLLSFKQATTAWRPLGSSSHPIISSHPRHGASRPSVSSHASRLASRTIPPGHQRVGGEDETSKRTRKAGTGNGTRNRGARRGERRNEEPGRGRRISKQGRQRGHAAITHKNKTPLILFRPTHSPLAIVGSPASISPPPPGRGMSG